MLDNNATDGPPGDLFRTDGHLTDLTIERSVFEELNDGETSTLRDHVNACPVCQQRLDETNADQESADLPPLVLPGMKAAEPESRSNVVQFRRRLSPKVIAMASATLAIAAGLLFVFMNQPTPKQTTAQPDGIRLRGGGVALQVFLNDGKGGRRLSTGDSVAPGDQVGFKYRVSEAGYMLIAGTDRAGKHYPCSPANGRAIAVGPTQALIAADDAIRFDAQAGDETIVALWCPKPFGLEDLPGLSPSSAHTGGTTLRDGCAMDTIMLRKATP